MDEDARELEGVERSRLRALVEGDVDAADPLHAEDFQLVTPSGTTYTKAEYLTLVRSGDIDYLVWEPLEMRVSARGDAGCLRYRARLEGIFWGEPSDPDEYWHTDYYERRDGRWQVVWSHATQIVNRTT
jgi:hypothetical protein